MKTPSTPPQAPAQTQPPAQTQAQPSLSYAQDNQHNLPGPPPKAQSTAPEIRNEFDQNRDPYIALQKADLNKSEAERRREASARTERRDSFMVARDQPKPTLRPGTHMAYGPDRAAFDQRWESQRQAASPAPAQDLSAREDRKAAFLKARNEQPQTREKTQTHNRKGDDHG